VVVVACCDPLQLRTFDLRTGAAAGWNEHAIDGQQLDMVLVDNSAYVSSALTTGPAGGFAIERRDLRTGEKLATSPVGYRVVAAGGGRVIAATSDGVISELDPQTLEPAGPPFPGINGFVVALAIDDAGRRLLVNAADDTLRVYDIPTRTPLGVPVETGESDATAALRGDGLLAAAATGDGIVTWDLDPAHWETAACQLAGRNLTRDEWDRYIGGLAPYSQTCPQYPAG
jgi:hypothetical protein